MIFNKEFRFIKMILIKSVELISFMLTNLPFKNFHIIIDFFFIKINRL